mmetsp:Transcript_71634/g.226260  ORF Transcript_71634/g.226260 Transcript_71634/m.226260 type:complete len:381 (-) Transcript_71634:662-1804(-)
MEWLHDRHAVKARRAVRTSMSTARVAARRRDAVIILTCPRQARNEARRDPAEVRSASMSWSRRSRERRAMAACHPRKPRARRPRRQWRTTRVEASRPQARSRACSPHVAKARASSRPRMRPTTRRERDCARTSRSLSSRAWYCEVRASSRSCWALASSWAAVWYCEVSASSRSCCALASSSAAPLSAVSRSNAATSRQSRKARDCARRDQRDTTRTSRWRRARRAAVPSTHAAIARAAGLPRSLSRTRVARLRASPSSTTRPCQPRKADAMKWRVILRAKCAMALWRHSPSRRCASSATSRSKFIDEMPWRHWRNAAATAAFWSRNTNLRSFSRPSRASSTASHHRERARAPARQRERARAFATRRRWRRSSSAVSLHPW